MTSSRPANPSHITLIMIRDAAHATFRPAAGPERMITGHLISRRFPGIHPVRPVRCVTGRPGGRESSWTPSAVVAPACRHSVPAAAVQALPVPRSGQVSGVRCQAESGLSTRRKCAARAHEGNRTPEAENDHDGRGSRS